jgi:hypothetical protein
VTCRCLPHSLYCALLNSHREFGGDAVEGRGDATGSWLARDARQGLAGRAEKQAHVCIQ